MRLYLESDEVVIASNGGFSYPNGNETEQLPLYIGNRFQDQGEYKNVFNTGK